jgi:CPA1 family monovalent cation:H+ antiporter
MSSNVLAAIAVLLTVNAGFAYFNHYVVRLPRNVGLLVLAFVVSLGLRLLSAATGGGVIEHLIEAFRGIDFSALFLDGFLCVLLFAGALEVDVRLLLQRKWTILALSTAGVVLSTGLVGSAMWGMFRLLGVDVSARYCLVFGALISPTDPVTVLRVLRRSGSPPPLRSVIEGESLFNDGIGIVLFTTLLALAEHPDAPFGLGSFLASFAINAGGGVLLGGATGALAFFAMRGIDEYNIELTISLALVTGTYALAEILHVSGPVAVVINGLIIGSIGVQYAVSDTTRQYLENFWSLADEILNSLLFLVVGLQFAVIPLQWSYVTAALLAIPVALVARAVSVAIPGLPLHLSAPYKPQAIALLTWSGLRGGISIALALSLPEGAHRGPLLTVCYAIVVFTMLVQGLTLRRVAAHLFPADT